MVVRSYLFIYSFFFFDSTHSHFSTSVRGTGRRGKSGLLIRVDAGLTGVRLFFSFPAIL